MGCCFSSSVENQQEAGTPLEPQSQTSTVPAPSTVPASSPDLPLSTSTTAILVSGIKQTTDEEVLKLFFENRRRSGGGPVQNVDYRKSTGRAVITFYDDKGILAMFKFATVQQVITGIRDNVNIS